MFTPWVTPLPWGYDGGGFGGELSGTFKSDEKKMDSRIFKQFFYLIYQVLFDFMIQGKSGDFVLLLTKNYLFLLITPKNVKSTFFLITLFLCKYQNHASSWCFEVCRNLFFLKSNQYTT